MANHLERVGRKATDLTPFDPKGNGSRVAGQVEHSPKMLRLAWQAIIFGGYPYAQTYLQYTYSIFYLVVFLIFCFFSSAAFAADLTLAWDSNSESDLAGYKVYYKTGSSGAPYDGVNADQGSSGIIVSLDDLSDSGNPGFTLSGLSENTVYYLAVTAYNEQGSESGYSNEVSHLTTALHPLNGNRPAGHRWHCLRRRIPNVPF